ncbi:MAG: DUF72 domain-containing protein [Thermoproteus sp. AZ2]|jgi:uncharacterized protein YecE (DUF72 family)|uniref:DUF72 domain-containing protein n=1 Tax=Thermoproteus sp. AZ2 TaxID=1609232 RepID=A0ACC6V001_9CREN
MPLSGEVYVGTSGWAYSWNPDGLEWYAKYSGLNAVEVNSTFYRMPTKSAVDRWRSVGAALRWSVKVYRYITHVKRLADPSPWREFKSVVEPLRPDFYLFQLPPQFKCDEERLRRIEPLAEELGPRAAVEFRDPSCYERPRELGVTIVSIDSPIGVYLVDNDGVVYLRMHGRAAWYAYEYSEEELREIARALEDLSPKKVYVFFNNDHAMLDNARALLRLLK